MCARPCKLPCLHGQQRANLDLAVFELELLCSPQRYQQAQTTQQQQVQAPQQVQQVPLQQALNQQVANDLPF